MGACCPVVSYRNSTSNHNKRVFVMFSSMLYLIEILHQTTTGSIRRESPAKLYLIEILHQTTTPASCGRRAARLYLIEILHQTTTAGSEPKEEFGLYLIEILHQTTTQSRVISQDRSCILSKFYIKPQQLLGRHIGR